MIGKTEKGMVLDKIYLFLIPVCSQAIIDTSDPFMPDGCIYNNYIDIICVMDTLLYI